MTIKIYGSMMSVPTLRTMLTADEKGVSDLEFEEIKWTELAQRHPEYLAKNPFGMMPVMVDGSLTLFESRAIMRYLAAKFEGQGTPLGGSMPEERALVDQWTEVGSQTLSDPLLQIIHEKSTKPDQLGLPADEAVLNGAQEKIGRVLDVYNAHLARNEFLASDIFTLADLSHLSMLNMLVNDLDMRRFVEDRPHVKAWWAKIEARRSWQTAREDWKSAITTFAGRDEEEDGSKLDE